MILIIMLIVMIIIIILIYIEMYKNIKNTVFTDFSPFLRYPKSPWKRVVFGRAYGHPKMADFERFLSTINPVQFLRQNVVPPKIALSKKTRALLRFVFVKKHDFWDFFYFLGGLEKPDFEGKTGFLRFFRISALLAKTHKNSIFNKNSYLLDFYNISYNDT